MKSKFNWRALLLQIPYLIYPQKPESFFTLSENNKNIFEIEIDLPLKEIFEQIKE